MADANLFALTGGLLIDGNGRELELLHTTIGMTPLETITAATRTAVPTTV